MNSSRANGVIFLGQSMLHDGFNQLADANSNFVVWGAHLPGQKYRSVGSDNVLGGRRATLHLARLGRKAIAFVGSSDPEAMQRRQGYVEALEANGLDADPRSEEHTSELQSLMRISYAVFCLKKKKTQEKE